jgi:predicted nucleic acid-binding Zn ribbon protein
MAKGKSSKRTKMTAEQRRVRGYQIFFYVITGVVLISMILSQVK